MESFNESAASVASPKTVANNLAITKSSEATASPEVASASDPLTQSSESYPEDYSAKVAESYPEDASSQVAEDTVEQSSVGEASINGTNNEPTSKSADSEAELGGSAERESGAKEKLNKARRVPLREISALLSTNFPSFALPPAAQ